MTTYDRLHRIVSPHLVHYRNDLEKHDLKQLSECNDRFIYGFRRTGTSLLFLKKSLVDYFPDLKYRPMFETVTLQLDEAGARDTLMNELVWIIPGADNKRFLYFDGKAIKELDKERITAIWRQHVLSIPVKLQVPHENY